MLKIAVAGKERYPYAYDAIIDKRYMDDIMDAKSSERKLVLETKPKHCWVNLDLKLKNGLATIRRLALFAKIK